MYHIPQKTNKRQKRERENISLKKQTKGRGESENRCLHGTLYSF
jgi:hypothetical protein